MPKITQFPPSVKGLMDIPPDVNQPQGAILMTNWVPTQSGIRNRKGKRLLARLPNTNLGRPRIHSYKGNRPQHTGNERIFLTNNDGLWEATYLLNDEGELRPRDYNRDQAIPILKERTGDWSDASSVVFTDNLGNTTITFVGGANFVTYGEDQDDITDLEAIRLGTLLTRDDQGNATPIVEPDGTERVIPANRFNYIFSHKQRLVLIERDSLTAYQQYDRGRQMGEDRLWLDIDLAPHFQKGGTLLFGGSVSMDTGKGPDDFLYFVSSEGEVTLFEVLTAATGQINLIGTFQIPKPLGKHAHCRVDGDTWIATENGVISLLSVRSSSTTYLTAPIQDTFRKLTRYYPSNWEMLPTPLYQENLVVLYPGNGANLAFALNIQTGAWTLWQIELESSTLFENVMYIADTKGIYRYFGARDELWENDQISSRPYQCTWLPRSRTLNSIYDKRATMAKFEYQASWEQEPEVFATDIHDLDIPTAQASDSRVFTEAEQPPNTLGEFVLGVSTLGVNPLELVAPVNPLALKETFEDNYSIEAHGKRLTAGVIFLLESQVDPEIEIISMEMEYQDGISL